MHVISADTTVADTIRYDTPSIDTDPIIVRSLNIAAPLKIFETSLLHEALPYVWQTANISAIHKKDNKSELCNYCRVSLTCIICKLMEKNN